MEFARLNSPLHNEAVIRLVYDTFHASEGEQEAATVSGLVAKYLANLPRTDLKGFTAVDGDAIVGVVFFSEFRYPNSTKTVYILSPMAVKTSAHGRGIGKALIRYAHDVLRDEGVNIVTTYGDVNFYGKSGYRTVSTDAIPAPFPLTFPEGWLAHSLDGVSELKLAGPARCIPELSDPVLW